MPNGPLIDPKSRAVRGHVTCAGCSIEQDPHFFRAPQSLNSAVRIGRKSPLRLPDNTVQHSNKLIPRDVSFARRHHRTLDCLSSQFTHPASQFAMMPAQLAIGVLTADGDGSPKPSRARVGSRRTSLPPATRNAKSRASVFIGTSLCAAHTWHVALCVRAALSTCMAHGSICATHRSSWAAHAACERARPLLDLFLV
ncbi:hypothetical protein BS78_05G253300 [Paspalum vaginatum]|nr:hypothetical protein BS78_05G253300 [Paspalum vaginatum]